jgi:RND family efflux transporter MFP subunit
MRYLNLALLLLLVGCTAKKENQKTALMSVKVVKMQKVISSADKHYVGQVEGSNESVLSFQVIGNVQKIFVNEGDYVRKGQLLAQLDVTTLQQMHRAAQATLSRAQDAYDRMKPLYDSQSISAIDWKEVETSYKQAISAEAIARKNVKDAKLYAPYKGVIASKAVELGENVALNQPIFRLCKINPVHVIFSVPENEIGKIEKQKASVRVEALNGKIFEGEVVRKNLVANLVSHAYNVDLNIANPTHELLPGMVCDVTLNLDNESDKDAFLLPNRTVQVDSHGGRFVWIVKNDIVYKAPVKIGDLTDKGLMITKGLNEGDLVVTEGYQRISEKMKVRIL